MSPAQQLSAAIGGEETIALGEKVLDCSRAALVNRAHLAQAPIVGAEPYRLSAQQTLALVGKFPLATHPDRHAGPMIGKMEKRLGQDHRERVGSFETKEITPARLVFLSRT